MIRQADHTTHVAIIGAGPAGVAAAIAAVRRGAMVTLIDKAAFPRDKVCGCCLNRAGLTVLDSLGVGDVIDRIGGVGLRRLRLGAGGRSAGIALDHGRAVSRTAMDHALIERAVELGVRFLPGTKATVVGPGRVRAGDAMIECDLVIAADGLRGDATDRDDTVQPDSRIGIGATIAHQAGYEAGTIHMACGPGGYVGLVRVEAGRLNIAAAFDAAFIRDAGSPGDAVARTLAAAGFPTIESAGSTRWHGTPALTRQRRAITGDRLLVVGDSAGYVEPFTGEGMAWALAGGAAAGALAAAGWRADTAARWAAMHRRTVRRRQGVCRLVAATLRRPTLTRAAVDLLRWFPAPGALISRRLNRPPRPLAAPPRSIGASTA